jgi:hypothetical protein|tara:strand:- start:3252 stop:3842 length:591 start_codon:yes stop_codon:yes gene_type:complete
MPLWGATDSDESKPKFLTDEQKKQCFATKSGWVLENGALTGNDNANADPEILVAIGELATSIGAADITQIEFITTAFDKSDGGNIDVRVRFNEAVDVVTTGGTPTLAITNGNQGTGSGRGPHAAAYTSGTGTNELVFRITLGAANAATNEDDVLVIGANALALNSGTIKDAGKATNSTITNIASIGTAAGSITVVA